MNRRHLTLIVALVATLSATWWAAGLEDDAPEKAGGERAPRKALRVGGAHKASASVPEAIQFDAARVPIPPTGPDLFAEMSFAPKIEPKKEVPPPPPAPTAPPLPFRYLGALFEDGGATVFLGDGQRTHVVRAGDTIDGRYRIDAITPKKVTFVFLPLDQRQELVIGKP